MKKTSNSSFAELTARLRETRVKAWQYVEVKQMAEILTRHREKLRAAIRDYRTLSEKIAAESDATEKLYLGYEAIFARDHLRDALRLYVMVNHDYHEALEAYLAEMRAPGAITHPLPQPNATREKPAPRRRRDAA
ncbi:MAG: hypothetical protein H6865_01165 [Rhodospirillales bacterium]|nr:hypothetical protein [Alphaproteobacteria bacterium]MCB9986236.1 hypothetical protein [Rhodospirillales bacterium]USO07209.1 MAG: hypothetical protein H6866_07205 [Rhodospirillales bacterium]